MESSKHLILEEEKERLERERLLKEFGEQIGKMRYCGGIMPKEYRIKKMSEEEVKEIVNNLDCQ